LNNKKFKIFGKNRQRLDFSRVKTHIELPNLIEVQTKSFNEFITHGVGELFKEIGVIKDVSEKLELSFGDFEFDEPKYSIWDAKRNDVSYTRPLKVDVMLKIKDLDEEKPPIIKQQKVFMGEIPMMTPSGTFVINGAERVIVTQIIRSAGVFFSKEIDPKSGKVQYKGQVIPTRGAWIEYEINNKDEWYAKLDKSKKIPLTTFLRAMGLNTNRDIIEKFGRTEYLEKTFMKDDSFGTDDALEQLYDKLRQGEKSTPEQVRLFLTARLFDPKRYDLASVGRYKVNKKLDVLERIPSTKFGTWVFATDIVDPETGEIVIEQNTPITPEIVKFLRNNRRLIREEMLPEDEIDQLLDPRQARDGLMLEILRIKRLNDNTVIHLVGNDQRVRAALTEEEKAEILAQCQNDYERSLKEKEFLEIEELSKYEKVITLSDIFASVSYYMNLYVRLPHDNRQVVGQIDDIDHLGNRRLRLIGELLQNQFRIGLSKMEKNIRDRMSTATDLKNITPQSLINIRSLNSAIREFFGSSQLSQFMDQVNPLSELTNKRRLSALGAGGLSRDRAGFEVRDVHTSHYGRICPIETPEGQNIGLINSLATFARVDKYGFIETPYFKVEQRDGKTIVTDEVVYLTADAEEEYYIAQANIKMNDQMEIIENEVIARYRGDTVEIPREKIQLIDVSPQQIVSVSTALIPFLEHNDANRALMGANMQRQAVPLLRTEAPIVGTGIEGKAAKDSGAAVTCLGDGIVTYADSLKVIVQEDSGKTTIYDLVKFARSNNSTCINQRPIVRKGERVKAGDVIADGPSMDQGELALGRNVLIAFMTWDGYNYEDAVVLSERLVQEDIFTSIHIEKYEVEVRDTKLGREEITNELDNEKKEVLAKLDEHGIIRLGAEVKAGDILVGKVTPKGQTDPTPEERLSQALFSDHSKDVRNTSLRVPHGGGGIVHRIERFSREDGVELPPEVHEVVRVYIVQKRKISEGDKMAGRHGNKGVISKILPVEDMPYLEDGTPIDVMLNPLGVPSRLNIGQVLETHLGMAAKKLGLHVVTPVFDGAENEDLTEIMAEANMAPHGKTVLYDGRTGRKYDNEITAGVMYLLKLVHMVDDKIHARSEGPYTLVTQQPMGGKAQNGGQRFGEMEIWALEAYGAAHILREMLTIKSDDIIGRNKVYKAIVDGENIPTPGIPEAFRVLVKELQGLGISVKLIDSETGRDVANDSIIEQYDTRQKYGV